MLCSNSEEAYCCYYDWQKFFKQEFISNCSGTEIFKAAKYIKPNQTGKVAPLYHRDKSLTSNKEEQADLLFQGTSVAHIEANLADI
ncbi:hypothetical protein CROQUDRAFT_692263, partial [Cronartium quercuum f. sp. fusiforme G11]